jgi:hypothetical protein
MTENCASLPVSILDASLDNLLNDDKRSGIEIQELYPVPEFAQRRFAHPHDYTLGNDLYEADAYRPRQPAPLPEFLISVQQLSNILMLCDMHERRAFPPDPLSKYAGAITGFGINALASASWRMANDAALLSFAIMIDTCFRAASLRIMEQSFALSISSSLKPAIIRSALRAP